MKEKQQIEKITDLFGRHVDPPSPACRVTRDIPLYHFSQSKAKRNVICYFFFFLLFIKLLTGRCLFMNTNHFNTNEYKRGKFNFQRQIDVSTKIKDGPVQVQAANDREILK